jgi:hypothetical protein
MNFNKIVRFIRTISNDPDLGRFAYNHEYAQIYVEISPFKSNIYKLFLYLYRNSDTEKIPVFKTYAVDLRLLLCEKVVCLITGKRTMLIISRFHIYIFIHIKKEKRNKINK